MRLANSFPNFLFAKLTVNFGVILCAFYKMKVVFTLLHRLFAISALNFVAGIFLAVYKMGFIGTLRYYPFTVFAFNFVIRVFLTFHKVMFVPTLHHRPFTVLAPNYVIRVFLATFEMIFVFWTFYLLIAKLTYPEVSFEQVADDMASIALFCNDFPTVIASPIGSLFLSHSSLSSRSM
jgi:hypothetical protein